MKCGEYAFTSVVLEAPKMNLVLEDTTVDLVVFE